MSGFRRALLISSAERYAGLAVSFVSIAAVSRLLTPAEIGTSAIGSALIGICISIREFAACGFLIQGEEVTRADVRTAFTVQFGLTLVISSVLFFSAPLVAEFYEAPMLADFVRVVAVALVLDTFAAPITSLLRRDLAFGTLAIISTATLCISGLVTVLLAAVGFSFMSIAWAWLAATLTTVTLSLFSRPDLRIFRPTVERWRRAAAFGGYNGGMTLLNKLYEGLPQLVLGRLLPMEMVGLYNRTVTISGIADKFILAGIFNAAFPLLANEFRAGRSLQGPLLKAFSYITAFYWPALVLMGLLAHPLVALILGEQWDAAAPLLQIMAVATLAWFPAVVMQPLLLAVGATRDAFLSNLIGLPASALVLCVASGFGVEAMAISQLVTTPFQVYVGLCFVRRHVPFGWEEMVANLRRSALVTICSGTPALLVIGLSGFEFDISFGLAVAATGLSACGWIAGIRVVEHPIGDEIRRAVDTRGCPAAVTRIVTYLLPADTGKAIERPPAGLRP